MSESDADKKRNKLGYQRISVACGHCRRRKIRCVMAENDAQNRCQNCIRLQKQCIFYPVDQPLPSDRAGSSTSRAVSTSSLASSSAAPSPQDLPQGASFEQRSIFTQPIVVPSNAPQGYPNAAYEASLQAQAAEYGYRPPEQYSLQYGAPSTVPSNIGMTPGYTQMGGFQQYVSQEPMGTPIDARSYSFPGPEENRQWQMYQQQGRAMSYGNLEAMPVSFTQIPPAYASMQPPFLPHLNMQDVRYQQQFSGPQSAPPVIGMQQQFVAGSTYPYQQGPQPGWTPDQQFEQYDGTTTRIPRTSQP